MLLYLIIPMTIKIHDSTTVKIPSVWMTKDKPIRIKESNNNPDYSLNEKINWTFQAQTDTYNDNRYCDDNTDSPSNKNDKAAVGRAHNFCVGKYIVIIRFHVSDFTL